MAERESPAPTYGTNVRINIIKLKEAPSWNPSRTF
jgi:hypothetical protein